jgi:hypothetical protein
MIESMLSTTTAVRYVLPAALGIAGIAIAVAGGTTDTALEGGSMFVGAGLSVLVLSLLFRYGTSGDIERDAEEAARRYLDDHGHWPDEAPPTSRQASIADGAPNGGSEYADPVGRARVTPCHGREGQPPAPGSRSGHTGPGTGPRPGSRLHQRLGARRPRHQP